MEATLTSEGLRLGAHFARPPGLARVPGLVLCHGFPSGPRGAATYGATYPELAERLARDAGWAVLTFNFRGSGPSEGNFSIDGWAADLRAAIDALHARPDVTGVWIAGSSLGGSLAIRAAAEDDRVRGVATLGAPASLREWAREPARFLEHVRSVGLVRDADFPPDVQEWARAIVSLDIVGAVRKLPPRPLFVLQGSDDEIVPVTDARELVDRAGPSAELRIIYAAGHRLRHDPRAVAALLGWLDRQIP